MTRLKAILRVFFHVGRRNSAAARLMDPRLIRAESDFCALLVDDDTPEHERGEW